MNITEIKKELYKLNPFAHFISAKKGALYYEYITPDNFIVLFRVPFEDMGDAAFGKIERAKHLIRYIYMHEKQQYDTI